MLFTLIGIILYPLLTGNVTRTAPLKGSVLGALIAVIAGFLMPFGPAPQQAPLTALSVQCSGTGKYCYQVRMLDEQSRLVDCNLTASNSFVKVCPDLHENEIRFSRGTTIFSNPMMWAIGIKLPSTIYELDIPPQKVQSYSAIGTDLTNLYTNDKVLSPTPAVASAR